MVVVKVFVIVLIIIVIGNVIIWGVLGMDKVI